jgi:hypothetical protein
MARQQSHVTSALAQRRKVNAQDIETEIEVGTEALLADERGQIAVAGSDDADIGTAVLLGTEGPIGMFLKKAEELTLHGWRKTVDFIQKEGAPASDGNQPFLLGAGIGESPAKVAEEFALKNLFRNATAFDRHKWAAPAAAEQVDGMRAEFLTGSGFAAQQNGSITDAELRELKQRIDKNGLFSNELLKAEFRNNGIMAGFARFSRRPEQTTEAEVKFIAANWPKEEVVDSGHSFLDHS